MRAADVVNRLLSSYEPPRWAAFPELHTQIPAAPGAPCRRMDLWVCDTFPASHFERVVFEVKVSRADYVAEIRNPAKRRPALMLANRFYFAVPAGLVKPDEVPLDCGLIEVYPPGQEPDEPVRSPATVGFDSRIRYTVQAPWRDVPPPPGRFLAAVARRSVDPLVRRKAELRAEVRELEARRSRLRRELRP